MRYSCSPKAILSHSAQWWVDLFSGIHVYSYGKQRSLSCDCSMVKVLLLKFKRDQSYVQYNVQVVVFLLI